MKGFSVFLLVVINRVLIMCSFFFFLAVRWDGVSAFFALTSFPGTVANNVVHSCLGSCHHVVRNQMAQSYADLALASLCLYRSIIAC